MPKDDAARHAALGDWAPPAAPVGRLALERLADRLREAAIFSGPGDRRDEVLTIAEQLADLARQERRVAEQLEAAGSVQPWALRVGLRLKSPKAARLLHRLMAAPARFHHREILMRGLGQGAFRLTVTDSYQRRCAVSGEKTLPILDAAHIKAYSAGGEHELSNGLLLRTDIHKLFDLGYVTVTKDHRFAVSERLKADFDNGAHYYAMLGREIARPRINSALPSAEALVWHRENRYLG